MKRTRPALPKVFWIGFWFLVVGLIFGTVLALAFVNTQWSNFHGDFFFWGSIVMTISSIALAGYSIAQYLGVEAEKRKGDAQVKIWMETANGLHQGLRTVSVNCMQTGSGNLPKYTSVGDVGMAIYALADSARALYQSLYEERCVTEEEYVQQQREIGEAMHKQRLEGLKKPEPTPQDNPTKPS